MKYRLWNTDSKIVKTRSRASAGRNARQVGIPTQALINIIITYTGPYDLPRVPGDPGTGIRIPNVEMLQVSGMQLHCYPPHV